MSWTDEQITAEPGIEIPKRQSKGIYPWLDMNVGDSFVFPYNLNTAYTMASNAGKKHGRKFTVRSSPLEGGEIRIWRVR